MVWLWGRRGAQVGLLVCLAPKCTGKSPKPPPGVRSASVRIAILRTNPSKSLGSSGGSLCAHGWTLAARLDNCGFGELKRAVRVMTIPGHCNECTWYIFVFGKPPLKPIATKQPYVANFVQTTKHPRDVCGPLSREIPVSSYRQS